MRRMVFSGSRSLRSASLINPSADANPRRTLIVQRHHHGCVLAEIDFAQETKANHCNPARWLHETAPQACEPLRSIRVQVAVAKEAAGEQEPAEARSGGKLRQDCGRQLQHNQDFTSANISAFTKMITCQGVSRMAMSPRPTQRL